MIIFARYFCTNYLSHLLGLYMGRLSVLIESSMWRWGRLCFWNSITWIFSITSPCILRLTVSSITSFFFKLTTLATKSGRLEACWFAKYTANGHDIFVRLLQSALASNPSWRQDANLSDAVVLSSGSPFNIIHQSLVGFKLKFSLIVNDIDAIGLPWCNH